jgi:hypothetical protein
LNFSSGYKTTKKSRSLINLDCGTTRRVTTRCLCVDKKPTHLNINHLYHASRTSVHDIEN